jgi:hypothetical protein
LIELHLTFFANVIAFQTGTATGSGTVTVDTSSFLVRNRRGTSSADTGNRFTIRELSPKCLRIKPLLKSEEDSLRLAPEKRACIISSRLPYDFTTQPVIGQNQLCLCKLTLLR